MALEVEYKFLVTTDMYRVIDQQLFPFKKAELFQGYLTQANSHNAIRVRMDTATDSTNTTKTVAGITIKGKGDGFARPEFEYDIPLEEAQQLLELCAGRVIDKTRYYYQTEHHVVEVDVFHGNLEGLIIAEIEVASIDTKLYLPDWLVGTKDVTTDYNYANASLATTSLLGLNEWKKL